MPWVSPSFAAEYWNIPVEEVMDQAQRGFLPSLRQNDWLFVDFSFGNEPARAAKTWSALSDEELSALNQPIIPVGDSQPELAPVAPTPVATEEPNDAPDQFQGWSEARKVTQGTRKPPARPN